MILLEAYLSAILLLILFHASVTDLKFGKIPNKSVVLAAVVGILGVVPYYALFAEDCLLAYGINNLLTIIISLLLYAAGVWGAGDCKLLCLIIFLFPGRLYCMNNRSLASVFVLISLIFLSAFVYIIGETLYLGIKRKDLMKRSKLSINIKSYLKGFLFYFLLLNLWNALLSRFAPVTILADALLIIALQFVVLLMAMQVEPKASWTIVGIMALCWTVMLMTGFTQFLLSGINWKIYFVVLVLVVFRSVSEKYNYQMLEVSELKPGMVLSFVTIMMFTGSRVKGLPTSTTEDLKSRLTLEEVESIKRWAKTKLGRNKVVIVRKMPFALFISIGTFLFAMLEVLTS